MMLVPAPMVPHHQQSYITPHFDCCDVRNAILPLMMPSAPCDANASTNGITLPKKYFAPHFNHIDVWNAMAQLMMPSASCDADASTSGIT